MALIIGGLEVLGGLVVALDAFSELEGISDPGNATTAMNAFSSAAETIDTTVSTRLSPKLKSPAKNFDLGVVIIVEVAAAITIFTGAAAIMGLELEKVGEV